MVHQGFKARECIRSKNFKTLKLQISTTKVCFDQFCVLLSNLGLLGDSIVFCVILVFGFSICLF